MKKYITLFSVVGILGIAAISCEKEEPAKTIEGNYSGYLKGTYDGQDTVNGSYPVYASVVSKNKVKIEATLFPAFEVLVTQQGINVDPVSTDDQVYEFLYQGNLKELSFKFYKNGDSTTYIGTKP